MEALGGRTAVPSSISGDPISIRFLSDRVLFSEAGPQYEENPHDGNYSLHGGAEVGH
jgi:hypothetical protein